MLDRGTSTSSRSVPGLAGVELVGTPVEGQESVLALPVLAFVARLERMFRGRRNELLQRRLATQMQLDQGWRPAFAFETREIRERAWTVAPIPPDLADRRVEITGPVDRKMIIKALASGANCFMADFEDSCAPTWRNIVEGQINLRDAVRRTISYTAPENGRVYELPEGKLATLIVRPRGWHLVERHLLVDGEPVSASIFDFAVYLFHNADELVGRGSGPYFYLPKLENHLEARLWNDVFIEAQRVLGLPQGTIRATVLIETLLAAFEMDEILFELREHCAGLNCGRWDYIFSYIKKLRADPRCIVPDRSFVTMEQPFLRAYSQLLIKTCHARGAYAMGGMAAQIPIKHDDAANERALERVRADKRREAGEGHDGTWVAHPGLVGVARAEFDPFLRGTNQLLRLRPDVRVAAAHLLTRPTGPITEAGLQLNVEVTLTYLHSWFGGLGCVPIHNLMEDAATAEISRAQIWQWVHHHARLDDGRWVDVDLVRACITRVLVSACDNRQGVIFRLGLAATLLDKLTCAPELADFLTIPAYQHLD